MSPAPRGETTSFRLRAWFAFGVLAIAGCGLFWRAIDLQLVDKDFYISQGESRFTREVVVAATRGSITDRNGEALAISTPVDSVWVNPQELVADAEGLKKLATALGIRQQALAQRIASNQGRTFLWLVRHLGREEARAVRELGLPGVHFKREYRRYYPAGEVSGHVVGFTDVDELGIEGIEIVYDHWLAGEDGRKRVIQDPKGRKVQDVESISARRPGRDLSLSLDQRIQNVAYRELLAAIRANRATSGSMVVVDVASGEVVAMVNQPTFNPNDRAQISAAISKGTSRNRAATDMFEPGSSIKPFVVAAGLESGRFNASSIIDTTPRMVGGKLLEDEHTLGPTMGLAQVLAKSSNVGMANIALALEPQQMWGTLSSLGFGHVTASHFPGESAGMLSGFDNWRPYSISSMSRGYSMSVTALQLAQAYATIGALGIRRPISMLRVDETVPGERVLSERTSRTLIALLEQVVTDGTGTKAFIPGYRVAGKTGTAQMNSDGTYYDDRYTAVFGGVAPASRPRLAAVVVINDPGAGRYYGGDIAAPVFSAVVGHALRLLGEAPDATNGAPADPLTGVAAMVRN